MDFEMSHFGENPNSNWKIYGSGFLNRKRSDPDPYPHPHPDQQQPFKAARPDSYNNTMSLFSSYQTPPAYIGNRGLFTPSQWMELQQQALIYKHIVANVPVPSLMINHIKKSLDPFVFSGSASTSNATSLYGWGSFRLGFSANNDPEPGRCRRTDGKKWRCSKEAVPDQKYCEKHINRGRHRSRKLVEGKNGGGGDGDGGDGINNQFKNLQPQKTASAMNRPEEDNEGSNSIPFSWQNSIGGPLGEALRTCSSNVGNSNSNHHHSLSWCSYSPTGVFSRSDSSSASSPRDGGGEEMFSLSHANSASFQSSM